MARKFTTRQSVFLQLGEFLAADEQDWREAEFSDLAETVDEIPFEHGDAGWVRDQFNSREIRLFVRMKGILHGVGEPRDRRQRVLELFAEILEAQSEFIP